MDIDLWMLVSLCRHKALGRASTHLALAVQ
jgi:hypothetical protein